MPSDSTVTANETPTYDVLLQRVTSLEAQMVELSAKIGTDETKISTAAPVALADADRRALDEVRRVFALG